MFAVALLIFLVAMCQPAHADARVYGPDADGDTVVLTQEACTLQIEAPVPLAQATLTLKDGTSHAGCWALVSDGVRILWAPGAPTKGWRINPSLFRKVNML